MNETWPPCKGVAMPTAHQLVINESRFFWRVRVHICCARHHCDLDIVEPSHPRFIRTAARLEYPLIWLRCTPPVRFLRRRPWWLTGRAVILIALYTAMAILLTLIALHWDGR